MIWILDSNKIPRKVCTLYLVPNRRILTVDPMIPANMVGLHAKKGKNEIRLIYRAL